MLLGVAAALGCECLLGGDALGYLGGREVLLGNSLVPGVELLLQPLHGASPRRLIKPESRGTVSGGPGEGLVELGEGTSLGTRGWDGSRSEGESIPVHSRCERAGERSLPFRKRIKKKRKINKNRVRPSRRSPRDLSGNGSFILL